MRSLIQARISDELADAARQRARDEDLSLSAYLANLVQRDVNAARRADFWDEVERTMTTSEAQAELAAESDELAGTLADGLER